MFWVGQGVLLLNTALTVPKGMAGCHRDIGWEDLIGDVILHLGRRSDIYWMFWGKEAQRLRPRHLSTHQFMETSHPAARGRGNTFNRSSPFVSANRFRASRGLRRIYW